MPRPRKRSNLQLSPGQASYVLERIIADRRVSERDVSRYVSDMRDEITRLEQRLQGLRQASDGRSQSAAQSRRGSPAAGETAPRTRRRKVSAEQQESRQIQGRYLGLIRQIPASRRSQYQKIARERGREAAIKEMAGVLAK